MYQHRMNILKERKALLLETEQKIADSTFEVEQFIASIPDSDCIIRRIINMRILEGKTWDEVAAKIGGGNSADSVKQMYSRYVRSH